MAKGDSCLHEKVRSLCRDINNRADDRQTLLTLAVRLQDALLKEQCETRGGAPYRADG